MPSSYSGEMQNLGRVKYNSICVCVKYMHLQECSRLCFCVYAYENRG